MEFYSELFLRTATIYFLSYIVENCVSSQWRISNRKSCNIATKIEKVPKSSISRFHEYSDTEYRPIESPVSHICRIYTNSE